ncbi:MAG: hypothetical protein ACPG8T_01875, partial [Paracoccaceae bacterium]
AYRYASRLQGQWLWPTGLQPGVSGTSETVKRVQHAGKATLIMPGGGITAGTVTQISKASGVHESSRS